MIHAIPLLAMCERADGGRHPTVAHPTIDGLLVHLYDGYPGGSGIADTAYEHFEALVALTLDMVSGCDCGEDGCPKCCWSKLCGSDNEPLDRCGAIELLRQLHLAANADGRLGASRTSHLVDQLHARPTAWVAGRTAPAGRRRGGPPD